MARDNMKVHEAASVLIEFLGITDISGILAYDHHIGRDREAALLFALKRIRENYSPPPDTAKG